MTKREGDPSQTVPGALAGKRLDACVKQLFALSWNDAREAIASGKIRVDDALARDGAQVMAQDQCIAFSPRAPRPPRADELRGEDVVFCDDALIVVDKPAGVLTVPFGDETDTLDARVRRFLERGEAKGQTKPRLPGGKKSRPELGVVH